MLSKVPKEIWTNFIRTQLTENTLRDYLFTVLLKVRDCATLPGKQQRTECCTTLCACVVPSLITSFSQGTITSMYE